MVRVNLIEPRRLADQHLIAEYNEILMLLGYVRKFPNADNIPNEYNLGIGHIKFFKNKLEYLRKRHEEIKAEMKRRGFICNKEIILEEFDVDLKKDWKPEEEDFEKIKLRIKEKIMKKPNYYRYYGEYKEEEFLIDLLD